MRACEGRTFASLRPGRHASGAGLVEALVGLSIATGAVILSLTLFTEGTVRSHDLDRLDDGLRELNRARTVFGADMAGAVKIAPAGLTGSALELLVVSTLAGDGTLAAKRVAYRLESWRDRVWLARDGRRVAGPFLSGRFFAGRDATGSGFVALELTASGTSRGIPTTQCIRRAAPHALDLPGLATAVEVRS